MNATDEDGLTILHHAMAGGSFKVVELLVLVPGIKLNCLTAQTDPDRHLAVGGCTIVHAAAHGGHLNLVKYAVETLRLDASKRDGEGNTALHYAAEFGHLEVVKYFLTLPGVDASDQNADGGNALHVAALGGHVSVVKALLLLSSARVFANAEVDGAKVLHAAAFSGSVAMARFVVEELHLYCVNNNGQTAMVHAAQEDHIGIVQHSAGTSRVDVNVVDPSDPRGFTALHEAAFHGHLELVAFLSGIADVNKRDSCGCTALHIAVNLGHTDVVKYLVMHTSVEVNATTNFGETALYWSIELRERASMEYLIGVPRVEVSQQDIDLATQCGFLNAAAKLKQKQEAHSTN